MSQQARETPPGPDGRPFVGNTLQFADDPLTFIEDAAADYGPVAYYELGGEPIYQVSDPDLVEHVLVHNNQAYEKGEVFNNSLRPTLGNGLLTSEGEFWREQRHTMQPAFHPRMIQSYADTMVAYTERMLDDWTDGDVIDVHEEMMQLTVEIAAKTLFDVDIREEEEAIGDALAAVMDHSSNNLRRPISVPDWIPTKENRRFERALDDLNDVVDRIVHDYRNGEPRGTDDVDESRSDPSASQNASRSDDVVSLLLRADGPDGDGLSDEQIRDEIVTILLAGHETTALALTYTLHALGENPTQEDLLHAEVDGLDGAPGFGDLDALDYTDRAVTEGMRLYPPVWQLLREASEPDEIGGYRIPEGATVGVQQWVLHHDDRYYDDPWDFRPDRWTDDFKRNLPSYAYFPFGGGPRRCIGDRFALLEARLALATIARDWRTRPQHDLSFAPSITLRPDGAVEMRVERR
ncbi:cytochrome P450 [Halocalculus aciditolerans]|uniref:Cytochrome P450 n=1 Tax=Halocalculus aciditolerans TaxID=1383812 RepID=A0A830EZ97_9EURY|nr:cytochrome P450 [Halocalculus aciditolerans]GGL46974.1 cytochrome P450 [Halocalculus aciditolerans]